VSAGSLTNRYDAQTIDDRLRIACPEDGTWYQGGLFTQIDGLIFWLT
jgi:hypothetical protein